MRTATQRWARSKEFLSMSNLTPRLRREGFVASIRTSDPLLSDGAAYVTVRRMPPEGHVVMVCRTAAGQSLEDALLNQQAIVHGPLGPEVHVADLREVLRRAFVVSQLYARLAGAAR